MKPHEERLHWLPEGIWHVYTERYIHENMI